MAPSPKMINRFPSDAIEQRAKAQSVLDSAKAIRDRVSGGSYDDNDYIEFLKLIEIAGVELVISNAELSERAGRSRDYLRSLLRRRERVRLPSMLSVLTSIIEVADERLSESGPIVIGVPHGSALPGAFRPEPLDKLTHVAELANVMAQLARREIEALRSLRPNDPEAANRNSHFIDLLEIFAVGFENINNVLSADLNSANQMVRQERARNVAQQLGDQVASWLIKHGEEIIDATARLSLMAGGIAVMSLCGAEMKIATGLVGAAVLGPRAASVTKKVLGKFRKPRRR